MQLKPGTFYVNTSQGFVVEAATGYTFTADSRNADTYPTWKQADNAGRASVKNYEKEDRYWSVLRPAIGQYATE